LVFRLQLELRAQVVSLGGFERALDPAQSTGDAAAKARASFSVSAARSAAGTTRSIMPVVRASALAGV
jgi:hypothetical protein